MGPRVFRTAMADEAAPFDSAKKKKKKNWGGGGLPTDRSNCWWRFCGQLNVPARSLGPVPPADRQPGSGSIERRIGAAIGRQLGRVAPCGRGRCLKEQGRLSP